MGFAKFFRHKERFRGSAQKVSGAGLKESLKRQFKDFKNAVAKIIHKYLSPSHSTSRRSPSPGSFGIATASDPSVAPSDPRRWPVSNPDPPSSDSFESDTPDPDQEPEPEQGPVSEHSLEFEQEPVPKQGAEPEHELEYGPEPVPGHEPETEPDPEPGLSCSWIEDHVRNRESRPLSDSSLDVFKHMIETGYVAQARRLDPKAWDEYMDMGLKII
ncbi:uncharacterized protein LDX57_008332 [Aspergillus melleus]|uniref:uncharacterized protein n=1 Tax=Aspergillus melleus TaxID=138277 RepID=UPI001E8CF935|nr:uncharacterized protein LDX57_008332 [Aspergillus melleus]KAH8430670.1 hypothetical protein LDX57_008332 [Aspergillus melleus]